SRWGLRESNQACVTSFWLEFSSRTRCQSRNSLFTVLACLVGISVPPFAHALTERRKLALECLGRTAAPAFRNGLRHGIGEDLLLPSSRRWGRRGRHGPAPP